MVTQTRLSTGHPPADASISSAAALAYWDSVTADVNGMLGGYPQISRIDLQGSANFIARLRRLSARQRPGSASPPDALLRRAVDCGAGIGRITAGLLVKVAEVVDVVEPVGKFTDEITQGEAFRELREQGKIGLVKTVGLEDWDPLGGGERFDLIWNQWCLGQLKDQHLIDYLRRAKGALAEDGWIVVKENMSTDVNGDDLYDETDSSVTRTDESFRRIFHAAGLQVRLTELQRGIMPSLGLYPVRMYGLRP